MPPLAAAALATLIGGTFADTIGEMAGLYAVSDPPNWPAVLFPYLAAMLGQLWLVRGDRQVGRSTTAGIFAPEPVVSTSTLTTAAGAPVVRHSPVVPAPGTWINQQQLIDGQRNDLYLPLVLDPQNRCFQAWKRAGRGVAPCR